MYRELAPVPVAAAALALAATVASAQVNVAGSAAGAVASQSSNWSPPNGLAAEGNDGNRDGRWGIGSVTHTNTEFGAWWEVQLGGVDTIDEILIFNRTDCCANRIDPFKVELFNGPAQVWVSSGNVFTNDISFPNVNGMVFSVGNVAGDRIRVTLERNDYLHIAELEAYRHCYADCEHIRGSGVLDIFDFLCFQNRFDANDPYACDCDPGSGPGVCDIFDFLCFQNAFAAGCP